MNSAFIAGDKIALCTLDKDRHFENCYKWFNVGDTVRNLLTDTWPTTYDKEIEWFDHQGPDRVFFAVEIKSTGKHIGITGLHYINWIDRTARTVVILGDQEDRVKGFGSEAKQLIVSYAFDALNLRKLSAHVIACNIPSIKMNLRCGFTEEAVLRDQVYRDGKYHDVIILSKTRS